MKIPRSQLGPLTEIANGSFGRVHRAPQYTLPGDPSPLAYKEFTSRHAEQARAAEACVDLWARLMPQDRSTLGSFTAWPRALVVDGRRTCGLLMPLLDDAFFYTARDPITGATSQSPRAMAWLISTQAQRTAAQADVPDVDLVDRYVLLAKLAYVFALLHRMGWVYGDLSFTNVAFSSTPPTLRLMDCDAAAPLADRARKQAHTPFWHPPEADPVRGGDPQLLQDTATDVYKLGLAVLRCVTPGKGASSTSDPARIVTELDPDGIALITRALSADRSVRPTAKEIYQHLADLVAGRIVPPALEAELTVKFLLRGQDAQLRWTVARADTLVIEAPNGQRVSLDPTAHPRGYGFRPEGSGPVAVVASNRFGTTRAEAGDLNLYELPPVHIGKVRLPQPEIGALDAFSVPSLPAIAAQRPMTEVGAGIGPLPSISASAVLDELEPVRMPPVAFPRWTTAIDRAAQGVGATVVDIGTSVATAVQAGLQAAQWNAGGRLR